MPHDGRLDPQPGALDPQLVTLLATAIGGLLAGVGTLGATWLNNRHQALLAAAERAEEATRRQEERAAEDRAALERRREAAANVVRDSLRRIVEAASVAETLRLEVEEAIQAGEDYAAFAMEKDRRQRVSAVVAEFGRINADMTAFGGDLATKARAALDSVRAALEGSRYWESVMDVVHMFEVTAAEWLKEHARVTLSGTTPAQTAPNEMQIEGHGTHETDDASQ